jgi:ATP-dependent Lon protease
MVVPLFVGRDKSISALNEVMKKDKKIILVTQKNSEIDIQKKLIFLCVVVRAVFYNF